MAITLSAAQFAAVNQAVNLMLKAHATELPFDATVIQVVAPVAAAIGFVPPGELSATSGAFFEAAKNNPISTLLSLVAFIGHP